MVTDAILAPLVALARWLVGLLPVAESVTGPDASGLLLWLARVNSIVPIGGIVAVAVGVLSFVVVFVVVRAALTVWHIVWP